MSLLRKNRNEKAFKNIMDRGNPPYYVTAAQLVGANVMFKKGL